MWKTKKKLRNNSEDLKSSSDIAVSLFERFLIVKMSVY